MLNQSVLTPPRGLYSGNRPTLGPASGYLLR